MKDTLEHVIDSEGSVACPFCWNDHEDDLHNIRHDVGSRFVCDACEKEFVVFADTRVIYGSWIAVAPLSDIPNGQ